MAYSYMMITKRINNAIINNNIGYKSNGTPYSSTIRISPIIANCWHYRIKTANFQEIFCNMIIKDELKVNHFK